MILVLEKARLYGVNSQEARRYEDKEMIPPEKYFWDFGKQLKVMKV